MSQEFELVKKIHAGADNTCYSSILRNWEEKTKYEQLEELMDILCKGVDMGTAVNMLQLDSLQAKSLLKDCERIKIRNRTKCMYDHMLNNSDFLNQCKHLIEDEVEDTFFSLNSFYKPEKASSNVRHLNAFALDFDYYKDERYEGWEPQRFYNRVIRKKLPLVPTAVIDSGRGIYVIYAFKHCSYHMEHLYQSIMKAFLQRFKDSCMDAGATLITQVIRLPGTINSKSGRKVSIILYNNTDYCIQDFTNLLPWKQEEVAAYHSNKKKVKKIIKEKNNIGNRKPYYKDFYEDMQKLIILRNRNGCYEGYRETLLYLVRERAVWSGYSIDESVKLAMKLNEKMHLPLSENEVEKVCKPSAGRRNCSIETIIRKLNITLAEQKKLKIIKHKWIKKSEYAKRKRKTKLTNLTEKQQKVLERRTRVCELKNKLHLSNNRIADILGVNKSTVTRDLKVIQSNPARFKISLKDYMDDILDKQNSEEFRLRQTYDRQVEITKWIGYAKSALDYLIRELDVVVT